MRESCGKRDWNSKQGPDHVEPWRPPLNFNVKSLGGFEKKNGQICNEKDHIDGYVDNTV